MFIVALVLIFTKKKKKKILNPNIKNLYIMVFVNSLRFCFSIQMFLMLNSCQKVSFYVKLIEYEVVNIFIVVLVLVFIKTPYFLFLNSYSNSYSMRCGVSFSFYIKIIVPG
jgi:hypothetical protein